MVFAGIYRVRSAGRYLRQGEARSLNWICERGLSLTHLRGWTLYSNRVYSRQSQSYFSGYVDRNSYSHFVNIETYVEYIYLLYSTCFYTVENENNLESNSQPFSIINFYSNLFDFFYHQLLFLPFLYHHILWSYSYFFQSSTSIHTFSQSSTSIFVLFSIIYFYINFSIINIFS